MIIMSIKLFWVNERQDEAYKLDEMIITFFWMTNESIYEINKADIVMLHFKLSDDVIISLGGRLYVDADWSREQFKGQYIVFLWPVHVAFVLWNIQHHSTACNNVIL